MSLSTYLVKLTIFELDPDPDPDLHICRWQNDQFVLISKESGVQNTYSVTTSIGARMEIVYMTTPAKVFKSIENNCSGLELECHCIEPQCNPHLSKHGFFVELIDQSNGRSQPELPSAYLLQLTRDTTMPVQAQVCRLLDSHPGP